MATNTPLQSIVLTSTASSVTFSGIDQSYTDLVLVCSTGYTSTNVGQGLQLRFNNDSSSNYSATVLEGDGSTASSYRSTNATAGIFNAPANGNQSSYSPVFVSIMNYTSTTTYKSFISRSSGPTYVDAYAGLWRATPQAITSITIIPSGTAGNIKAGSTFDLYGIKSGAPKMMGGDVVVTDGTYWYHAFKTTGVLTAIVQQPITADILAIAGGGGGGGVGGGGYSGGGGGGAGGLLYSTSQSFTATSYAVTVGAGGVGGVGVSSLATSGSNSQIAGFTAAVGGGFGGTYTLNGGVAGNGGSGGGMSYPTSGNSTGTSGQGNAGGARNGDGAGGGGGAGAAGQNAPTIANGGNGGAGLNTYSSWASATSTGVSGYYAGGGGGAGYGSSNGTNGAGGSGGGGQAYKDATGGAGTTNTGSGGGGVAGFVGSATGGAGGSGIVIVRYAV